MAKKKVKSYGHLESAIAPMMDKLSKPKLDVRASISHYYGDESHFRKKEAQNLQKEIDHIEKEIKNWNGEAVADKALKSLKSELAMKRARKMEAEAYFEDSTEDEIKPVETEMEK